MTAKKNTDKKEDLFAEIHSIDFKTSEDLAKVCNFIKKHTFLSKLKEDMWEEKHEDDIFRFLIDRKLLLLVIYIFENSLHVSFEIPHDLVSEICYFIKTSHEKVTSSNMERAMLCGNLKYKCFQLKMYFFFTLRGIRYDFSAVLSSFLVEIFDSEERMKGNTIFFKPKDVQNLSIEEIVQDKELVLRLEGIVMKWVLQMKKVLTTQSAMKFGEKSGPMDELAFWEQCCNKLNDMRKQLEHPDIKKCIESLQVIKSSCLHQFKMLHKEIEDGALAAADNAKFLSVLKEPCRMLENASLQDVPYILSDIVHYIRIIWTHSSYYNDNSKIGTLFRKVSNMVIKTCSKEVVLDELFHNSSVSSKEKLFTIIECCKTWKEVYTKANVVYSTYSPLKWNVDYSGIFAPVDAFIQRCKNLLQVCTCKEQFIGISGDDTSPPCVRGHKGLEIVKQLFTIEQKFGNALRELSQFQTIALDIRATAWHSQYSRFQTEVREIEVLILKLLSFAFENFMSVEEGLEILYIFHKHLSREMIKRAIQKYTKRLYFLLGRANSFVKMELLSSQLIKNPFQPAISGTALWTSLLHQRLENIAKPLEESTWLPESDYSNDILADYYGILEALDEFSNSLFTQWGRTVQKDAIVRLSVPLMCRNIKNTCMLDVNFDRSVLKLLQELTYWEKKHVEIPFSLGPVNQKREEYLKLKKKVTVIVREYNRILAVLCSEEQGLFRQKIRALDRKVQPGLVHLTWTSSSIIHMYMKDCKDQCQMTQKLVTQYKSTNKSVIDLCEKISKKFMFYQDIRNPILLEKFHEKQKTHYDQTLQELRTLYEELVDETRGVFEIFKADGIQVFSALTLYLERVDDMLETALYQNLAASLGMLSCIISGTNKAKPRAVLKVAVSLESSKVKINPSIADIIGILKDLVKNMILSSSGIERIHNILTQKENGKSPFCTAVKDHEENRIMENAITAGLNYFVKEINSYLENWQPFCHLWETDENAFIQGFKESNAPAEEFDVDITRYAEIANSIERLDTYTTVQFCIVNSRSLKKSAVNKAEQWKNTLISLLHETSKSKLENIYSFVAETSERIKKEPDTIEELKLYLKNLRDIKEKMKHTEATFDSLHQNFFVLKKYEVSIDPLDIQKLDFLEDRWKEFGNNVSKAEFMLQQSQDLFKRNILQDGEELRERAAALVEDFNNKGPFSSEVNYKDAFILLENYGKQLRELQDKEEELGKDLVFFNVELPRLHSLESLQKDLEKMHEAWKFVELWDEYWSIWKMIRIQDLEAAEMENKINMLYKQSVDLQKRVNDDKWIVLANIILWLQDFLETIPLILDLQNKTLKPRHWKEVHKAMDLDFDPDSPDFNMKLLKTVEAEDYPSKVAIISAGATTEYSIEIALRDIRESWETVTLEMAEYKDFFKLIGTEDIFNLIEDNHISLSTMKGSKFCRPFAKDLDQLECSLSLIQEVVELAQSVQKRFLYLENIFLGEDIKKQLPLESTEFEEVAKKWQSVTLLMKSEEYAWTASHRPDMLETLISLNIKLEGVQQSLEVYIETKRQTFPRFYFVSNDDLLSILGQLNNPRAIQPHMKKCFDNLIKLKMEATEMSQFLSAKGMHSEDGEYVEFVTPIVLQGPVESWLRDVEKAMVQTLRTNLLQCFIALKRIPGGDDAHLKQRKWMREWPGQLCLTSRQMLWTADCTKALRLVKERGEKRPLKKLKRRQVRFLDRLSEFVRVFPNNLFLQKTMAMITIEVHARDVIESLIKVGCNDSTAFEWISQLRYYWEKDKENCWIQQTTADFWYGYEYLGNSSRLVITPLTDRCYLTLTTALHLNQGASPKGPTGTGKTETVKDLGKALGCYVLVVNCSEGLDFKSLGRMFSGLAQIGAWGSFDEFNRVNVEVLSVVAQQIQCIFTALREKKSDFFFEGHEIVLKHSCGIFITMNPGYYAGRVELPYNLTYMFRPMSMVVPDTAMIAEILLFAEGFVNTKPLAKKIQTMYFLAAQQLSKQFHYDFGLRGMVTVLRSAGRKRRLYGDFTDEEVLLLAITDMNMPKLHSSDIPLFNGIVTDLFPNVEAPAISYTKLKEAIEMALKKSFLQPTPTTIEKVLQFYDSKHSRHAVIIVGETGSGKTTTWKTLKYAYDILKSHEEKGYNSVKVYPLNPKSVTLPEVFGEFNMSSGDWIDGILSSVIRTACNDEKPDEKWIVLDGPADTQWIESMNSLLDDNKILTLINGERIALSPQVSLVLEVLDLSQTSPATVSRCGIVYQEYSSIGWEPYFQSWLQKENNPAVLDELETLVKKHLPPLLKYKKVNCSELISTTELNGIISLCRLMSAFITEVPETETEMKALCKAWFIFSLIWSVCASVNEEGRRKIDIYMRELDNTFPSQDTVYEYHLDPRTCTWIPWEDILSSGWKYNPQIPFYKILVPTVDTLRYHFIISTLLGKMNPVLLVGNAGTGKTLIAHDVLKSLDTSVYNVINLNLSYQTSSKIIQDVVESKLEKKTRNLFIPIGGKKLITFLDDFNMPAKDRFGAQSPLEILRLWMDHGFWYDRKKIVPKFIQGMQLMAAMAPPGGGRNIISSQVQNRFTLLNITFPQEAQLQRIFGTMIQQKLFEFEEDVKNLAQVIVSATLEIYNSVASTFLPTPTRMHYLFSLRDIAKVFQGLLQSHKDYIDTHQIMTRFWIHECLRVFSDRLVDHEDKSKFLQLIIEQIGSTFNQSFGNICPQKELPTFVNFMNTKHVYEDIKEFPLVQQYIYSSMNSYNESPSSSSDVLDLVLFQDAVEHVCRILRGVGYPGGNMLLIGVGGSGRQSLSRLAAFMLNYCVFSIEITKYYGVTEFKEDLKKIFWEVGVKQVPGFFLLSDKHFGNEIFLQYVNDILTNGEIPNLYQPEELEAIYSGLSSLFDLEYHKEKLHVRFTDNIKLYLHIVICLSPSESNFRQRMLNYPALINNTTIDWFGEWPQDALESVATKYLVDTDVGEPPEERRPVVASVFCFIHQCVANYSTKMMKEVKRRNYVSPINYLDMAKSFNRLLVQKRKEIITAVEKLRAGLYKIDETREKVQVMTIELNAAKAELEKCQIECDAFIVKIQESKEKVDKEREIVSIKREKIAKEEISCRKMVENALKDLNEALPALEEAKKALESLNKKDIGEIKSYPKPPPLVEKVCSAVMILRKSPGDWAEAKRQLGSPTFLKELMEFDKDHISDSTLAVIRERVAESDFVPELVGKVSKAAKSLCLWVKAMYYYGLIYKDVLPKKRRAEQAEAALAERRRQLAEAEENLREFERQMKELTREYDEKLATKEKLRKEMEILSIKFQRAHDLVEGLISEKERWEHKVEILEKKLQYVIGDSLIGACFISYLGPFLSNYRSEIILSLMDKLRHSDITCTSKFDLAEYLIPDTTLQQWKIWGLPTDQYSIENAIIITESRCWPLVIDPQGQAIKWIKNMEGKKGLKIIDLHDADYLRILENSIAFGTPVLLQNIQTELDPALDPLLKKSLIVKNNKSFLHFCHKDIEFNKDFRFYIATKLNNPYFSPEITSKICLVNFALKEKGLEDQLLAIVVKKERPDMEEKKNSLVSTIAIGKSKLQEIEDTILRLLNESQGSLLDDEVLVGALKSSKLTSHDVEVQLHTTQMMEVAIDAAREEYRPCAERASILFFVLNDMSSIDPMYIFSLDAYTEFFISSIEKSPRDPDLEDRIIKLNDYHTFAVYKYACYAMFEKHKLLLSFHMCAKLLESSGKLNMDEYEFFLKGGIVLDRKGQIENPCPLWLSAASWDNITELEKLPRFQDVTLSFEHLPREWHDWYISAEPENTMLPGEWKSNCNELQKMLFIRSLRPDRVNNCVTSFVINNLGLKYAEPPVLHFKSIFDDSVAKTPLIFILSPGVLMIGHAHYVLVLTMYVKLNGIIVLNLIMDPELDALDPSASVFNLAKTLGMDDRYFALALGQGQAPNATKLIDEGIEKGHWVFLANCHLMLSWMPKLEKIIEDLQTAQVHDSFRLWLSSVPTSEFPISVLQNSIKITTEPPKGVSAIMKQLYLGVKEGKEYEKCRCQDKYFKLLFSLCYFHSVLIERKKFQYLGWNVVYNFNESDFKISERILSLYLDKYEETPWSALKHLIAVINYGGHVTDDWDRRLLQTYINQYFCEEAITVPSYPLSSLSTYCIPREGSFDSCIEYVNVLPGQDKPEVFGQNPNAEVSSQIQEASMLFEKLLNVYPVTVSDEKESLESKVLYHITELISKVPETIDELATGRILENDPIPFHVILVQEVQRYNALIKIINTSLKDLEQGIHGIKLMTPKLEEIFNSISDGHVPSLWLKTYPSNKALGSWIRDLADRVQQFADWTLTTHPPVKYWLAGFTSPTSFLTAVLQTAARKNVIPIDLFSWEFAVSTLEEAHIIDPPVDGVFVRGLYLEGAGWDKRNCVLMESEPMQLITPMPVIHFKPVAGKKALRGYYQCPCYYFPRRAEANGMSAYVVTVELKSGKQPADHWIKRGTALLMSLSD